MNQFRNSIQNNIRGNYKKTTCVFNFLCFSVSAEIFEMQGKKKEKFKGILLKEKKGKKK